MDVMKAIRQRRSIRAYGDAPVEPEKLRQVMEAARLAPSASNRQEWKFVVVREQARREKLAEAAHGQAFVAEAPVVIVACAQEHDRVMSCGHASFLVDVSIAVDHMTLAARELDLGTCWIGAFDQDMVRDVLDIPPDVQVVALLPLGYATEWPAAKPRKSTEEIVCYEQWS